MAGYTSTVVLNDATKVEHHHVLGMFDWAIALAEKEERAGAS